MKIGHLFSGRANLFRRLALAFVCGQIVSLLIAFNLKNYVDMVREPMRYHFGSGKTAKIATNLILIVYVPGPPILTVATVAALGARRVTRCRNCHRVLCGLAEPRCDRCGEAI